MVKLGEGAGLVGLGSAEGGGGAKGYKEQQQEGLGVQSGLQGKPRPHNRFQVVGLSKT